MVSFLCDGQGSDSQAVLSHDRSCFLSLLLLSFYLYQFCGQIFVGYFLWDARKMTDFYVVSFSKITYGRYNEINLSKNNLA